MLSLHRAILRNSKRRELQASLVSARASPSLCKRANACVCWLARFAAEPRPVSRATARRACQKSMAAGGADDNDGFAKAVAHLRRLPPFFIATNVASALHMTAAEHMFKTSDEFDGNRWRALLSPVNRHVISCFQTC